MFAANVPKLIRDNDSLLGIISSGIEKRSVRRAMGFKHIHVTA
tara:strand:- start:2482 stop:2610 length:129 start_codon:yes stop_codon:yes gene_type:complete